MGFKLTLIATLLSSTAFAHGEASVPHDLKGHCRNGHFSGYKADFRIAKIKNDKAGTVKVLSDSDDCLENPALNKPCTFHSLPRRFEKVLAGPVVGEWVCIYYSNSADWSEAENFEFDDNHKNPPLKSWVGKWSDDVSKIEISLGNDKKSLTVEGAAQWMGGKDADNNQIVHTGEIQGTNSPEGNVLIIGDENYLRSDYPYPEDCAARLTLLPDILVASDNSACGGANVRFNGVYSRVNDK